MCYIVCYFLWYVYSYWNTHTLIYISVQSYGKKTNRGVLVFLESGRISIF